MKESTIRVAPYVKELIEQLKAILDEQPKYKVYGPLSQSTVVGIAIQNKIEKYKKGVKHA
jgi:hypothetical protein